MLKKLIAYDFRCLWKLAMTLLGVSILAAIISTVCFEFSLTVNGNTVMHLLIVSGLNLTFGFMAFLAIIAAMAVLLLVAIHYYKKFVSDEAYLTFTLPASPKTHLLAKLISGSVWVGLAVIVAIIDYLIIFVPRLIAVYNEYLSSEYVEIIENETEIAFSTGTALGFLLGIVLCVIVALITQLGLLYLSLTFGGVVAQKQKALAGVGIYWLSNMVLGGVMLFASIIVSAIVIGSLPLQTDLAIMLVPYTCMLVIGGFGIIYFFINKYLLTQKLNLA